MAKPMRSLTELVEALKNDPGSLTPPELKFVRGEIKKRRPAAASSYEAKKGRQLDYGREKTKAGQDIGPIPPPKDLARKAAASESFQKFCETYFPHRFYLGWSADHIVVINRIEEAVLRGGLFSLAQPRASGKTSLCECACIWATINGYHKFVMLIGSSKDASLEVMVSIKEELLGNELLAEDYPEVCFPIGALEDRANRCKGQHSQGKSTKILWSTEKITLPTVAGSRASGATLRVAGITGRIRGAKKETLRPSLCILDDPQTDASANSLSQCEKRARIISGAVLGLAGPGKKMTAIMPCTVIREGDLADRFLDRDKSPLWTGQRFKLLYQFPSNMASWDQYAVMRADEFRNDGDGSQATAFYKKNRETMDAGAVVAWPERHNPDEISGIQYAMNLFYLDKISFWSEYQNTPLSEDLGDGQLVAAEVGARVNGLKKGTLPLKCTKLTAFIDVQQKVLFWLVAAWAEDFTGAVIDYGSWPDQGGRRYFTAADVQKTLARATPRAGLEAQIHAALGHCAGELLGRSFAREDGASFRIERLLVDAGFESDTVKTWCRTTHHAALVLPSHGHAITASGRPFDQYDRSRCEKLGLHWLIPKVAAGKKALRHVTIDTTYWKTFVCARLMQALGERGALTLYGKAGEDHRMIADHLTAEYWIETTGHGRKLHEWKMRPGMSQNHWWDCLVGSAVAASMQGSALFSEGAKVIKKRLTLEEMALRAEEMKRAKGG